MSYLIAPSLLAADMTRLGEEVEAVLHGGADMIHFDVMDNHYVPNLSFGPAFCKALQQRFQQLCIDVHIMATPTDSLIEDFIKAKACRISIHPDATIHLDRSLALIKKGNCKAGIALNPATSPEILHWCINKLDFVLVMTVNPGFGGQKLIPQILDKIRYIHQNFPQLPICVDGGITLENIASVAEAGALEFVAGSTIFQSSDYGKTIAQLRAKLMTSYE